MTQNEFKKFREDILKGFQLTSTPTIKSISALFFSGLISTYGIYSILLSVGIEGNTLYKAIGIFVLILIVADTFKRGALSNYYNSQIRNIIIGAKVLKMQLIVSLLALSFMTVFDIVGSFSTANYVEAKYQEFQATNSKEFELLESNAKNGQSELSIYSQELAVWQQDKKLAYQACNEKYRRWKAHYKADCKNDWDNNPKNAKPKRPSASGSVSVSDYKSVKEDTNSDFLSEYIFYIILFLSMALTILLQYTTISEIQNNKDEIDQSLTSMVIGILQDRLSELETNMVQHETKRNELISSGDKEEKRLGREFEKMGKGISLLSMGKAVEARGKTVERIANNEAMPITTKKAGFVDVSFNQKVAETKNKTLTKVDIVTHLYKDIESRGDNKLTSKSSIIDIENRTEDRHYKEVMEILKKGAIIKFVVGHGYYAIKGLNEALEAIKGVK